MGALNFVDKVSMTLGITPDRIQVVDVVSGSTIVDYIVYEDPTLTDEEKEAELTTVTAELSEVL